MFHAWLFYSGLHHLTTNKNTVFECMRWAQNAPGTPHALILLTENGNDDQTIEFRIRRTNGKIIFQRTKGERTGCCY